MHAAIKKKRREGVSFRLAELYTSALHAVPYFGVQAVRAGDEFKLYVIATLLEEQFTVHRVDPGFLHLSRCYYQGVLSEPDCKIIVGVFSSIG